MNNTSMFGTNPYYPPNQYQSMMPSQISYPQINNVRNVLPGRSVTNIDEITPGEIPMDGGLAIFPKSDGSAIYVKSFNGDMSMNTKIFIPAPADYNENPSEEAALEVSNADIMQSITDMMNDIDDMKSVIKNMTKNHSYSKNRNNHKNNNQNEGADVNA